MINLYYWFIAAYWKKMIFSLNMKMRVSIFIVLIAILFLLWYLITNEVNALQSKLVADQKRAMWMAQSSQEILHRQQISLSSKAIAPSSLLTTIDQEAKLNAWNKYPFEMKQDENHGVELSFSEISFDDLMNGIEGLAKKNNIQIDKISIQRVESTDLVTAKISLNSN